MSETFLSDAGSLFFAAWIVVVAAVGIVAFGRDLFPAKAHLEASRPSSAADVVRPTRSNIR
ncbi:MAG TPA: hypothetical protein VHW45_11715 [Candidatus Sulfotelmatobacter sp.]|jgi:hypothetical protein|nr:hypothetical protein [Candidatus Sulfotelmatobacter sp.]